MDREPAAHGSAKHPASASTVPDRVVQNKIISSPASVSSRHSPVTPLAPLEFLQNQRRGSITDPSLHAAGPSHLPTINTAALNNSGSKQHARSADLSASLAKLQSSPPFKFGESPSTQPSESTSPHLRRLLRSPSAEVHGGWQTNLSHDQNRSPTARESNGGRAPDRMDVDSQSPITLPKPDQLNYNSRRGSLAGTKRKMSPDRNEQTPGSTDIDPQLVGPGMPSGMGMDSEGPAPKRRSSAFDTRLAQLNLYDRRNSVDARGNGQPGGGGNAQMWNSERRDTSTPVFANTPMTAGGYTTTPSSAFSGDSPHGRPPPGIATFAWPTNPSGDQPQQAASPSQNNEANMANNNSGPYDPSLAMLPPGAFPQDRRMSAPNISQGNASPPPSAGPTRALRSRSRPPSRVRTNNQSTSGSNEQSPAPSTANPEESPISATQSSQRDLGSTPYSRSPELRVSHKLAERKRRKEMKDLFDELRDQLPADRGMKASKWEILSKAIDFINNLKQSHQEMNREIDMLRHEVEGYRQGIAPFPPGAPVVYGHPPVGVPPFPHPPGPGVPPPPPHHQASPGQNAPQPPLPRPGSSQNVYPPASGSGAAPPPPSQNGASNPTGPRTDTPT